MATLDQFNNIGFTLTQELFESIKGNLEILEVFPQ